MLLSYELKYAIFPFGLAFHDATQTLTAYMTTSRYLLPCCALPIYIYSVQLLTTYLPLHDYLPYNPKRSIDRFTPFHAIRLRFNGLYRGRAPLNTAQVSSAAISNNFLYIPRLYLKNNLYISENFFLKKIAYCLLYYIIFTVTSCWRYTYAHSPPHTFK